MNRPGWRRALIMWTLTDPLDVVTAACPGAVNGDGKSGLGRNTPGELDFKGRILINAGPFLVEPDGRPVAGPHRKMCPSLLDCGLTAGHSTSSERPARSRLRPGRATSACKCLTAPVDQRWLAWSPPSTPAMTQSRTSSPGTPRSQSPTRGRKPPCCKRWIPTS